jgi:streptomycin 6-kinase
MLLKVSARLKATCKATAETTAWLHQLPQVVDELARRWALTLGAPFDDGEANCAWVAPAMRADRRRVVLKLAMPHFEGKHEIEGLRFWSGDPTVQLLESNEDLGAMLLERCEPGSSLRTLPEQEQDVEIARLLLRLWRSPPAQHPFRPLSEMAAHWANDALVRRDSWHDSALVAEGLDLFETLSRGRSTDVVLATDLHAGNVLQAERARWLVIDPKPFVGDPAYDATQHLLNCRARLLSHPRDMIRRFADLLQVNHETVRRWTFARLALESSVASSPGAVAALARRVGSC